MATLEKKVGGWMSIIDCLKVAEIISLEEHKLNSQNRLSCLIVLLVVNIDHVQA